MKRPPSSTRSPAASVGVPVSRGSVENSIAKLKDPTEKVRKAVEGKYYIGIDLTGSSEARRSKKTTSNLKLSGAINRWTKFPNLYYQRTYRLVGRRDQLEYIFRNVFNLPDDEIRAAIANSYTKDNVEGSMKEEYEKEVSESSNSREGFITFNALTFLSDAIASAKYNYADGTGAIIERAEVKSIRLPSSISNSKRLRRTLVDKFIEVREHNINGTDRHGDPIYNITKILDVSTSDTGKIVKATSQSTKYAFNSRHPDIPIGSNSVERYTNALYEIYADSLKDPSTEATTREHINDLSNEMEEVIQDWISRNGFTIMSKGDEEVDVSPSRRSIRPPSPTRSVEPPSRTSPRAFGKGPGVMVPSFGKKTTKAPSPRSKSPVTRPRSRSRSPSPSPVLSPRSSSRSPVIPSPVSSSSSSSRSRSTPQKSMAAPPTLKTSTKASTRTRSRRPVEEEEVEANENPFD